MGPEDREANVVLSADVSGYSNNLTTAARDTNTLNDSVSKLVTTLDRLSRAGGRKLELISAGTIAGITGATAAAARFEQQMSTLQATSAVTGRSLGTMNNAVDSLRRSLPTSTDQVVALVTSLTKLGTTPGNVQKLADTFVKLSAATGEDLGTLATSMVELQRQMGTTEESTSKFASSVVTLSSNLGVSASGVLQFAQSLAPVARTVGMTQTEITGFSAAFQKAGQDGFAASNVFNKLVTDISRSARYGSNDIYAYANALGVSADQLKNMSATDQVVSFFDSVNKGGADSIKMLERLGYDGPRALKAIQGVAQSGGISEALGLATEGFNNNDLETGAKAAMNGLNDEFAKLRNNLTSIGQLFGQNFLTPVTAAVGALNDLAGALRTAMGPFNALLGMLGLGGGAATGIAGFALSNFTALAGAAAGFSLLRNPLSAGVASARRARGGGDPRSAFMRRSVDRFEAGEGTRVQQWMFGQGQRVGNRIPGLENTPGQNARNIGARIAMAGSGVVQTGLGLARSSIDPIRWQAARDMTERGRYPIMQGREAYRAAFTGEGASFGRALSGSAAAVAKFTTATASATLGLSRLGAQAVGGAARAGLGGLGRLGSGLMGLAGGPIGLGVMGAFALAGYAGDQNQKGQEWRDRMAGDTGADSAVNRYASALGLAGSATMSFAQTIQKAEGIISSTVTGEQASKVSPQDVSTATVSGRQLTNSALSGMSQDQAVQYAASVYATPNVDPKIQQAMKLDLIQQYGQAGAQDIITQAQSGNLDPMALLGNNRPNRSSFNNGNWAARGSFENNLSNTTDTFKTVNSQIATQFGTEESNRYTAATVNSLLKQYEGLGFSDQQRLAGAIEGVLGGENLGFDFNDQQNLAQEGLSQADRQKLFADILRRSNTGTGRNYLEMYGNLTPSEQTATSYDLPGFEGQTDLYRGLGVYNTRAGALVGQQDTQVGQALQTALASPDSANAQLSAATTWAQSVTTMTGSTTAATAAFQEIKGRIQDTSDPLYQMAQAAQTAAQRLQGYQAGYQSTAQNARTNLAGLVTAYRAPDSPDREQMIASAEDAYESARSGLYNQFRSIVKTYRDFNISQSRAAEDYATSRARQEQAYGLQQSQQSEDYYRSRSRSEEDFTLQRQRGEHDYWLSRQQQQDDFDKSRRRSEEDFQHQLGLMVKQQAQSISNIYERIITQPTWDAQNLLGNAQDQLGKMQQQQRDLSQLRGMGVSSDVIQQLGLNQFQNQQQLARFVSDLAENPELVKQWNESIKGRLSLAEAFVSDEDNTAYTEMQRQFNLTAQRAQEDFSQMVNRAADAYNLAVGRMMDDYTKQTNRGEEDYRRMVARQNAAYALSVKQTAEDWEKQVTRAKEDLNRNFEEVTGTFEDLQKEALSMLTGAAKDQMTQLSTALGQTRDEVKKTASGTADDIIKALAPLFGGEEAARTALGMPSNSSLGGPWANRQMNSKGGPEGSEHSHDSASSGAIGGTYNGQNVMFPLPGGSYTKTSGFGMRKNPVTGVNRLHAGYDFGARTGTPIGASGDGIVTKAGVLGGLGNMVEVTHGGGLKTWYGHMSQITSKVGQAVTSGSQLGLVGSTGNSTGPHLHFELHVNGQAVDPGQYLSAAGAANITGAGGGPASLQRTAPDVTGGKNMAALEEAMIAGLGGAAYKPGTIAGGVQKHVNEIVAGSPMDSTGGWYALGGIFNKPTQIGIGERGAEMVLPLNERGADFIGQIMAKMSVTGSGERVQGNTVVEHRNTTINHNYDQHTEYTGPINVQASDPREFQRQMEEQKRLQALTRPRSSTNG